jgi:hypothetical protein
MIFSTAKPANSLAHAHAIEDSRRRNKGVARAGEHPDSTRRVERGGMGHQCFTPFRAINRREDFNDLAPLDEFKM